MSSVSVLAPCGRRHNIKVTPNSTLLQVLEDVCKKSGLSPDEYDIRHYNKILDLTTLIRFSGLPNNAQLELVPAKILRQDSKVHIALQVGDNISRVTADFWPSDTLLNVIETLSPDIVSSCDKIIVVIYMRSEIIGIDNLKNTQLKTLGLTRGSAALRVILRDDALPLEQKVSGSGISSRPFQRDERSKKEVSVSQQNVDLNSYKKQNIPDRKESDSSNLAEDLTLTSNDRLQNQLKKCQTKEKSQTCVSSPKITNKVQNENKDIIIPEITNQMEVEEENIQYIGERNALIFNLSDGAISAITEELPDDFFDLTIDDYRILSRDYKRTVKEMDNVPLQTSAQRELQQSKQVLNMLHYKTTVIRIQFPDRTVIQGGFTPVETVSHVMEFVRQFLQVPDVEFYLFQAPPKIILEPSSHLVEANCVPRALVYFGISNNDPPSSYLQHSLFSKLCSPKQATKAALEYIRKVNITESSVEDDAVTEASNRPTSYPATINSEPYCNKPSTSSENQPKGKVPKWFKK